MNNKIIFLRHAKTIVDKNKPVSKWILTEEGTAASEALAATNQFDDVEVIITSSETKAYKTAEPLAKKLRINIIQFPELGEINRDLGPVMDHETYEQAVAYALMNRNSSNNNWETANSALTRFSKKVAEIDTMYESKTILIAAHAYVINMYFAKLLGKLNTVFHRLETNGFCDWGVIENHLVTKDIAK